MTTAPIPDFDLNEVIRLYMLAVEDGDYYSGIVRLMLGRYSEAEQKRETGRVLQYGNW